MTHRTKRAALFGLWLAACGRVDASTPEAGSAKSSAGTSAIASTSAIAGEAASGGTGGGGEVTVNPISPSTAGQSGFYPAPFDALGCQKPDANYPISVRCVTRAELADVSFPNVTLDGGVSALGAPDDWRCPQPDELTFSGSCGGERCCPVILCGPSTQRSSTAASDTSGAGNADAAGDVDAGKSEQACCYYIQEICGV